MPDQTYLVTAPDGRKVKLTGDHQPTDAELEEVFRGLPAPAKPTSLAEGLHSAATSGQTEDQFNAGPSDFHAGLEHLAHPKTLGDIMSLIVPSGIEEAAGTASRMLGSGFRFAKPQSGIVNRISAFGRGMAEEAFPNTEAAALRRSLQQDISLPAPASTAVQGADVIDRARAASDAEGAASATKFRADLKQAPQPPTALRLVSAPDVVDRGRAVDEAKATADAARMRESIRPMPVSPPPVTFITKPDIIDRARAMGGGAESITADPEYQALLKQNYPPDKAEAIVRAARSGGTVDTRQVPAEMRANDPAEMAAHQDRGAAQIESARAAAAAPKPVVKPTGPVPGSTWRTLPATVNPAVEAQSAMVEQLSKGIQAPPEAPPIPKRSVQEIPPSTSKRTPMSKTPGLTVNDVAAVGLNPDNPIKGLSQDAIERLIRARAARSGQYRTTAELDAIVKAKMRELGLGGN